VPNIAVASNFRSKLKKESVVLQIGRWGWWKWLPLRWFQVCLFRSHLRRCIYA